MVARLRWRIFTTKSRLIELQGGVDSLMAGEDDQQTNRKSGIAYAAAFSLFASVVSGLAIGWLLDRWLQTAPRLLVVGLVLGAVVGFYHLVRATSRLS